MLNRPKMVGEAYDGEISGLNPPLDRIEGKEESY